MIRLPAFEKWQMIGFICPCQPYFAFETNSGNARALVQRHGERDVWLKPPPIPLTTEEMDYVFDLPYARLPHPFMEMPVSCI